MKLSIAKTVIAVLIVSQFLSAVQAATMTATMTNTVTVSGICSITATGFTTSFDAASASNHDVTASISTVCTAGAAATVTFNQGVNAAAGSTDALPLRRLSNGTGTPSYLNYALYSDSGRSTVWGNTLLTGAALTGTGSTVNTSVFVRIPSGQNSVGAGTYTDTVVATITF